MAAGAVLIVLDWRLALVAWGLFFIVTALTRFVSFGAIVGAVAFPVALLLLNLGDYWEFTATFLCAVLIIVRHQANIRRLIRGEESRFSFRRKKR
jgi:glycerol-3-phosphate acyltransferase PlsY